MPVAASLTPRARQQVSMLRARDRKAYDQFLIALRSRGCKSLHYRLTGGELLERLCVVHLTGQLRVVVCFESAKTATILLVGQHSDDPFLDVYTQLYTLADLAEIPSDPRRKPPCCDEQDGSPPLVDTETLDDLVQRARQLSGADIRREQRVGRR
jgi:hypothetical protein